mgnify:CR=1 FL=1
MELKQWCLNVSRNAYFLLIVPYGIETTQPLNTSAFARLLIVPYGIETGPILKVHYVVYLLIVPYGIETKSRIGAVSMQSFF